MVQKKRPLKHSGFSVTELVIAVAIIGILTSVAIPSYREHVLRAGHTEGKSVLQSMMKAMEDFYLVNNLTYTSNLNTLTGQTGNIKTSSGDYTITASKCGDGAGGELSLSECVKLTATGPKNRQGNNETFTLDSQGNRTYNGRDGWIN